MFHLVSDSEVKVAPSYFNSSCLLAKLFSLISESCYVSYFGVRLLSSNHIEMQFSIFDEQPMLATINLYNHKGFTYVSLTQVSIARCTALRSYNLQRMLAKEWIPRLELPALAITVSAPSGQLVSPAFQQLEFTHVSVGNSEILIKARTTDVDRCRTLIIVVDICYPVPQFHCYDTGDQEGHSAFI
jgi:hypothetical protein